LLKAKLGKKLQQTAAVGSYLHNAFGLFDMHGNVCEWCADNFENSYYQVGPDRDPPGPEKSEYRAVRGGGWESHGFDCRSASRGTFSPTDRHSSLGFRVICLISDKN
jgi:formylglycine-generating enzyme required for sulfatase activity